MRSEYRMNRNIYWKLRKFIKGVIFHVKKTIYCLMDSSTGMREYRSFRQAIIKYSAIEILKGITIASIVLGIDHLLVEKQILQKVDESVFCPSIIGGIGIAGVILGLFCSNVATIYSTRYINAPKIIATAFQYDILIRKCVSSIVDYIAFGFVILSATMVKLDISWGVVITSALWSVAVIASYSIAGNRAYQLSDIYSIADDSNRILYRIISKRLNQKMFVMDVNFQNHFMKVAEKQIDLLKTIQKYEEGESRNDYTTMTEFMCKNLVIVAAYWKEKKDINRLSMWFRDTPKYQKWHMANNTESSLALRTGTVLRTKGEHNYWWFEDEILSINKACISVLAEKQDYASLYTYLLACDGVCRIAVEGKEANCYVAHVDFIRRTIEESMPQETQTEEIKKTFAGLVEVISLLYLNIILETSKLYKEFNFQAIFISILKSIDKGDNYDNSLSLRGRGNKEFYEKIITEVKIEGKRITPDWVIKQQIAKEEYVYLNTLLDIVREGMNQAFSLGKKFSAKGFYFEACIIFTRFYEYESKLVRLIEVVTNRKNELEAYHVDKELVWDAFRLNRLQETMAEWKRDIPRLLSDCSCHFALDNWENSEDFPDFLGESYNHICEDAVDAITSNNIDQFFVDYENLSKLMLLYQEYIRTDFVKKNNLYRAEYAYYMFTSPIVEWAQIGGLAILWGEFHAEPKWKERVQYESDDIFKKDGEKTDLPEKLIEYTQHRNSFMFGIGSRDILETEWQLKVANAIRENAICESEYSIYGLSLKTDSKLLKAFCPNFMDLGFTNDPSEVFWVTCVNPYLPEKKRFKTSHSWDEVMLDV